MTIGERLGHGVQEAVDRFGDVLLGEARSLGDLVHDIGLRHHSLLGRPARVARGRRVPKAGRAVPYPQAPTLSIPSWTRGYLDSSVGSAAPVGLLGGRPIGPRPGVRRPPARARAGGRGSAIASRRAYFLFPPAAVPVLVPAGAEPVVDQSVFCTSVIPGTSNVNACFFAK